MAMKDMIEVKTTKNNYKLGKTTINSRIGEDFEPGKPIMTDNNQGATAGQDKLNSPNQRRERNQSNSQTRHF